MQKLPDEIKTLFLQPELVADKALSPYAFNMLANKINEILSYLASQREEVSANPAEISSKLAGKCCERCLIRRGVDGIPNVDGCSNHFCPCHLPPKVDSEEKGKKCLGAHCKCMNLDKQCPNFHYRDGHDCPNDKVKIVPSDRIDYCSQCGNDHGYDCPLDNSLETQISQAIAAAYTHKENERKVLDPELIKSAVKEIMPIFLHSKEQGRKEERERILKAVEDLSIKIWHRTDGTECEVVARKDVLSEILKEME